MRDFAVWTILACAATAGCSKKPAEPARSTSTLAPNVASREAPATPPDGQHGTRRLRGLDVAVYVDGAQAGVLRWGDLPAIANVGTEIAPEFRLADYLAALGVKDGAVKSVWVYDQTNRVGSVDGKELLKDKERFRLRFAAGNTGIAETGWDTVGLKNGFVVHEIRKVAVFAQKDPPALDKARQCVLTPERECADAVPFQAAEPVKGTRVYLDGKMVGYVKRRNLGESLVVATDSDGADELSLAKLVRTFGVDTSRLAALEVVAGDDVVGRADAAQWARHERDIVFTLPKHQHGKVRVRVPADMQADGAGALDKDALVTSVLLYADTRPRAGRDVVAISDATDVSAQLAANEGNKD